MKSKLIEQMITLANNNGFYFETITLEGNKVTVVLKKYSCIKEATRGTNGT